jgi:hypothetical protein
MSTKRISNRPPHRHDDNYVGRRVRFALDNDISA